MKLVKGVTYGLRPVKRIYLGHDIVYDTRTFVLQNGHGDLHSSTTSFLSDDPLTTVNMICTVDMYAISEPETYDEDGVAAIANNSILSACAVGTFDDLEFAASHSDVTEFIKAMIAGITVTPNHAVVFGDNGVISVGDLNSAQGPMVFGKSIETGIVAGNGHSAPAKVAYGNINGNPFVVGDGHSTESVKAYSVDNNICFTIAAPDATRFIDIASYCGRVLACIGDADRNRYIKTWSIDNKTVATVGAGHSSNAVKASLIDNKILTTISDGVRRPAANAEANSALNTMTRSHISTDSQIFVDANSNLIINVNVNGDAVVPTSELSRSVLNIVSTLKVEDVSQRNVDANSNLHIESILDGKINDHIDVSTISKAETSVKFAPDITQPYRVNLSGVASPHTQATSMTWRYPEQEGDILLIFQAYDAVYNKETKTLEIK